MTSKYRTPWPWEDTRPQLDHTFEQGMGTFTDVRVDPAGPPSAPGMRFEGYCGLVIGRYVGTCTGCGKPFYATTGTPVNLISACTCNSEGEATA